MKQITCDCCNAVNKIADNIVEPVCAGCCKSLDIPCLLLKVRKKMCEDEQNPYFLEIGSNLPIFSRKPLTKRAEIHGNYIFSDNIDINSMLVQNSYNELSALPIFFTENDFQELSLFLNELCNSNLLIRWNCKTLKPAILILKT